MACNFCNQVRRGVIKIVKYTPQLPRRMLVSPNKADREAKLIMDNRIAKQKEMTR